MIIYLIICFLILFCMCFSCFSSSLSSIGLPMLIDQLDLDANFKYQLCMFQYNYTPNSVKWIGQNPECGSDPNGLQLPHGSLCQNKSADRASGNCVCEGWLGEGLIRTDCTCVCDPSFNDCTSSPSGQKLRGEECSGSDSGSECASNTCDCDGAIGWGWFDTNCSCT